MRPQFSERFVRSYDSAPAEIQRAFDRKLPLLLENLRHPSLRAKKYDETYGLWQAWVTGVGTVNVCRSGPQRGSTIVSGLVGVGRGPS